MTPILASVMTLLALLVGTAAMADDAAIKELVSTGKLRVGVVFAPAASAFFVTRDGAGAPHGVTVDLGRALAQQLGVPVDFMVAPNSGELTEATAARTVDVSFMPIDEERRKRLDFGPSYYRVQSTYLVPAGSDIATLADVDRPHITVVGIANTTTIRSAGRSLKQAKIVAAPSVGEAVAMVRAGTAQAFALSHDSLKPLAKDLPGSRILEGGFQSTGIAIAVAKGRPAALAYATAFMEDAKASGIVRRALDAAGLHDEPVAPPEARP
jgi:polar amino acid transport system substrate-binding protein